MMAAIFAVSSDQALAQTSAPPVKASLRLDWKGGGQHGRFYLARDRGYYKDEGIDLDIISGSGSSDVVKQVGSKAVEFGIADALVLVQAAEQRVPLQPSRPITSARPSSCSAHNRNRSPIPRS